MLFIVKQYVLNVNVWVLIEVMTMLGGVVFECGFCCVAVVQVEIGVYIGYFDIMNSIVFSEIF